MAKQRQKRHASALKAHRQSVKRNLRNREIKKGIRLATRAVMDAVSAKDSGKITGLLGASASAFDKAAQRGTIHWKTAARRKSRLAKRVATQLKASAKA